MFGIGLLSVLTIHFHGVAAQVECTDLRGRIISHGLHYVPGPDTCTLCECDNGLPKVCKAVLCSPPQDCRSFRVGTTCCEFICLDDVVKPAEGAEANVRVAAGGAAAVVLLTVALVVYRVRRQKRRRPPHNDDQRSLTSIGYISGSMGYMGGTCETALGAWKPLGSYLPRGEAPPPYDEAVAQCRLLPGPDHMRGLGAEAYHRTYPAGIDALVRPEDALHCIGHGYVNIARPVQQIANTQNCYNAPLLQAAPAAAPQPAPQPAPPADSALLQHHALLVNAEAMRLSVVGVGVGGGGGGVGAARLTGSLGAISARGAVPGAGAGAGRDPDAEPERPHNVPGFYVSSTSAAHAFHRTIPRMSPGGGGVSGGAWGAAGEVRRSFHRAGAAGAAGAGAVPGAGRSMPRNLDRAAADIVCGAPLHLQHMHRTAAEGCAEEACGTRPSGGGVSGGGRPRALSDEHEVRTPLAPPAPHPPHPPPAAAPHAPPAVPLAPPATAAAPPPATAAAPPPAAAAGAAAAAHPTQPSLPLTVDKPSCVCSYEPPSVAPGGEDADDYRSECENCKSASSSRWAVQEGWVAEEEGGTQTLQRRAPPPAPPPAATATLPQPVTKQSRTVMGPPSNWENWFNTIHDSDTESEEE